MNRRASKGKEDAAPVAFLVKGHEALLDLGQLATGNPAVDQALAGGFPRGAVVMLAGSEGAGKTCLTFDLIAYNQKKDPDFTAIYLHLESVNFPMRQLELAGVQPERLLIMPASESAENGFDSVLEDLCDDTEKRPRNLIDLVVVDSIAAAVPAAEIATAQEKGLEQATVALQARMMSKFLRIVTGAGCLGRTCLLFINQIRTDVGGYGNPEVLPGGKASVFYPKVIVKVRAPKSKQIREGTGENQRVVGHSVCGTIAKNNTGIGKPQATFEYKVIYGQGVDRVGPVMEAALAAGVIQQLSSVTYQLPGGEKIRGREALELRLREDAALRLEVEAALAQGVTQVTAPLAEEAPIE